MRGQRRVAVHRAIDGVDDHVLGGDSGAEVLEGGRVVRLHHPLHRQRQLPKRPRCVLEQQHPTIPTYSTSSTCGSSVGEGHWARRMWRQPSKHPEDGVGQWWEDDNLGVPGTTTGPTATAAGDGPDFEDGRGVGTELACTNGWPYDADHCQNSTTSQQQRDGPTMMVRVSDRERFPLLSPRWRSGTHGTITLPITAPLSVRVRSRCSETCRPALRRAGRAAACWSTLARLVGNCPRWTRRR